MLKTDAVKFFGSNTRTAIAAGVERSAVSQWKDVVPERCARRLADASNGVLVAWSKEQYDQHRKSKRAGKKNTAHHQKDSD